MWNRYNFSKQYLKMKRVKEQIDTNFCVSWLKVEIKREITYFPNACVVNVEQKSVLRWITYLRCFVDLMFQPKLRCFECL